MKLCPLGVMTLISLIAVFAILLGNPDNAALCKLIFSYSDANLTLLGIDIAALAILYALLQDKQMDENAKHVNDNAKVYQQIIQ